MHLGKSPCHLKKFYSDIKLGLGIEYYDFYTELVKLMYRSQEMRRIYKCNSLEIRFSTDKNFYSFFTLLYTYIFLGYEWTFSSSKNGHEQQPRPSKSM